MSGIALNIDAESLRPLIASTAAEVVTQLTRVHAAGDGRLGYREEEAAKLLGLRRHQLRDARLRGEVRAAKVGKVLVYSRDELIAFLIRKTD